MKLEKIESERLILRNVTLKDDISYLEIFSSDKVAKFLNKMTSLEKVQKMLEKKIKKYEDIYGNFFSVVLKEEGKVIGTAGVKIINEKKEAVISYVLNDKYWGKGYATEASLVMIEYAKKHLGAKTILADCVDTNLASIHILENKLSMNLYEHKIKINENGEKIGFNYYKKEI